MNTGLHTGLARNTLFPVTALVTLTVVIALAAACGGGGSGASAECLDLLYYGNVSEETSEQLMRPISDMDDEARLTIYRRAAGQGRYKRVSESPECSGFIEELEQWEETSDGEKWHENNGEKVASAVFQYRGVADCRKSLDYDELLSRAGDRVKLATSRVDLGDESVEKIDTYRFAARRKMVVHDTFEDDAFAQFKWELECSVSAEIDTKSRAISGLEVVSAELTQDGLKIGSYSK